MTSVLSVVWGICLIALALSTLLTRTPLSFLFPWTFVSVPAPIRRLLLAALRQHGPTPNHVAFIMDGNRRWARRRNLPAYSGHPRGFDKLIEVLRWCLEAGIETVTVYAFSIENFKRSETEVETLMVLAESKFGDMAKNGFEIQGIKFRVRVPGDAKLLRQPLRDSVARAVEATAHHKGRTLNVCLAYTGRDEIAQGVLSVADHVRSGALKADNVAERDIAEALQCHPVDLDILVRTSGERRLSDFMLWHASRGSLLSFSQPVWPDFCFFDFLGVLLDFHRQKLTLT